MVGCNADKTWAVYVKKKNTKARGTGTIIALNIYGREKLLNVAQKLEY